MKLESFRQSGRYPGIVPARVPKQRRHQAHTARRAHGRAATAPHTPAGELVGNFQDFDSLFEQLAEPPLFELGKPLPKRRFQPGNRVGDCPASHNRALLGDEDS